MLRLGNIVFLRARKSAVCDWDKEEIEPKDFYYGILYKIKASGKMYTKRYCSEECLSKFFKSLIKKYQLDYPNLGGRPENISKFDKLTEEQIKRRRTLLHWLSVRDRPALQKAYLQQDTVRVHKVMSTMYKRFMELETFGVTYPITVSGSKKLKTPTTLSALIKTYDSKFVDKWGKLEDDKNNIGMINLLLRDINDTPNWETTNIYTVERMIPLGTVIHEKQEGLPIGQFLEDKSNDE